MAFQVKRRVEDVYMIVLCVLCFRQQDLFHVLTAYSVYNTVSHKYPLLKIVTLISVCFPILN